MGKRYQNFGVEVFLFMYLLILSIIHQ